jgi:probable F420-dependent oxidoreductase
MVREASSSITAAGREDGLRFTLFEPTAVSPHDLIHLAVEAERCGFDSFAINDGTFQMRDTAGVYPYSPDNRRNWDITTPFYEPMTVLPAVAVRTSRIRLLTKVVKLPLHHPLVLAKQVATLAVLSGDRFVLGVGSSWAPEEYRFVGADWGRRGRLMEESIAALRLVLSGEVVESHGELIDFDPLVARPAPRVPVKILVGGHHEPSLRRAARLADGWVAAGPPKMGELRPIIRRLRELCDEHGRDWSTFEVHAYPNDAVTLDDYRRLEELGVTDAATLPINTGAGRALDDATRQRLAGGHVEAADDPDRLYSEAPPTVKLDTVRRFAETVISHWRPAPDATSRPG